MLRFDTGKVRMKIEEIEVTISADGKIRLHTFGFTGDTCLDATKDIEKLLGNQIQQREFTSEVYDQSEHKTSEKVKIRR